MAGREAALKDYIEVNVRIMKFYEKYPEGRILTEIVKWENEVIVMKATAYRDEKDIPASTGYAYEKEGSSFINKTSALENCETSAVGRCLAILGFEIKKSVASKEEVANAMLNQENQTIEYQNKCTNSRLTDKQISRLYAIAYNKGIDKDTVKKHVFKKFTKDVVNMSKDEYDFMCSGYENMQITS